MWLVADILVKPQDLLYKLEITIKFHVWDKEEMFDSLINQNGQLVH